MSTLDQQLTNLYPGIDQTWDQEIIPQLENYIRIPNKSVMFDPNWKANGFMNEAMQLIVNWCKQQPIQGMQLEVFEDDGHTPLLLIDIPGQSDDTILLYGHMDKQPEMAGWDSDKGPWTPVIQEGKLYGRGGADDGYAVFASLTAILALQKAKIPHARCVVLIEGSEESGSCDLPHYLKKHQARIGHPSLIICLDSGAGNYEQMWCTTSLRGVMGGELAVEVIKEGLHSGYASGAVPNPMMIIRQLLDRLENSQTGEIIPEALNLPIPSSRIEQAKTAAAILGDKVIRAQGFVENTRPLKQDIAQIILNRTWRPALSITGVDGLPSIANAGNVTVPKASVKISLRLAPTTDIEAAQKIVQQLLTENPPFQAKVTYTPEHAGAGWSAPELAPWLEKANQRASELFFGKSTAYLGEGGSIPFMGMLGEMFPQAQFLITGVLGPKSNAHGPNEFLHIDMGKKLTACVSAVIAYHFEHAGV